jgi:nitrite reductase (NO-forming)
MRTVAIGALVVVALVLGVAACDASQAAEPPPAVPGATEHEIWLDEMEFIPAEIEVPAGEVITLHLKNAGNMRHDLLLSDGTQSPMLSPGASHTMEVGPFDADVSGFCTVPGHVQSGMAFKITVLP